MTATTQMTKAEIEKRVAELAKTADEVIGHDEGTHGDPATHEVCERLDGTRYATRRCNNHITRITPKAAEERTAGRIRYSQDAIDRQAEARDELGRLRRRLAKMQ